MLSDAQVDTFRRDGFTVVPGFLSSEEVSSLLADVETVCAGNTLARHDQTRMEMEPDQPPEGNRVRRLYEPCTHSPRFRALADSARLLDGVEQLFGPDIIMQYSKLNMKPPEIGSVVEWHQDLSYYPLTNRDSLAVLFYLDEADLSNGCLQIIPGRYRGRLLDHTVDGVFVGRITEALDLSQAVPVEGGAGTAILMHAMAPHGSATNTSGRPRRTLILSYRAADAFPIYYGERTIQGEANVRLVRGEHASRARFDMTEFPVPRTPMKWVSLYQLQEQSRTKQGID